MASKFLKNLASPKFEDISVTFRQHESEPGKIKVRFTSGIVNHEYILEESDLETKINTVDSWLSVMLLESRIVFDKIAEAANE